MIINSDFFVGAGRNRRIAEHRRSDSARGAITGFAGGAITISPGALSHAQGVSDWPSRSRFEGPSLDNRVAERKSWRCPKEVIGDVADE